MNDVIERKNAYEEMQYYVFRVGNFTVSDLVEYTGLERKAVEERLKGFIEENLIRETSPGRYVRCGEKTETRKIKPNRSYVPYSKKKKVVDYMLAKGSGAMGYVISHDELVSIKANYGTVVEMMKENSLALDEKGLVLTFDAIDRYGVDARPVWLTGSQLSEQKEVKDLIKNSAYISEGPITLTESAFTLNENAYISEGLITEGMLRHLTARKLINKPKSKSEFYRLTGRGKRALISDNPLY